MFEADSSVELEQVGQADSLSHLIKIRDRDDQWSHPERIPPVITGLRLSVAFAVIHEAP